MPSLLDAPSRFDLPFTTAPRVRAKLDWPAANRQPVPILLLLLLLLRGAPLAAQPAASPIAPEEGRPVVLWDNVEQVIGKTAFVVGRIERIGHSRTVHFLNFHKTSRDVFTVVVFDEHLANFSDTLEKLYEGQIVKVRGTVTRYRGVPQIKVTSPDQIEVLARLPDRFTSLPTVPTSLPPARSVTVATWNVLNLFDDQDDPYRDDESTRVKPREELQAMADTLRRLNADVVALQEVESRGYLERFVEVFLEDMGYRHIVHYEGNDGRGIDVAVLSRLPVGRVTSQRHKEFAGADGQPQRFSRDILQVELLPPGRSPWELWAVHLKSNADGAETAEPIRLAEVAALRALYTSALRAEPGARVLIAGDFNDQFSSKSLQQLVAAPEEQDGAVVRNSLSATSSPSLVAFVTKDDAERQITYHREPHRSMIDFILASPEMAKRLEPGSYQVFSDPAAATASDHYPVRAVFSME